MKIVVFSDSGSDSDSPCRRMYIRTTYVRMYLRVANANCVIARYYLYVINWMASLRDRLGVREPEKLYTASKINWVFGATHEIRKRSQRQVGVFQEGPARSGGGAVRRKPGSGTELVEEESLIRVKIGRFRLIICTYGEYYPDIRAILHFYGFSSEIS